MASNPRVNILIYSGPGTSPPSLTQALQTLRHFLSPSYAVSTLSPTQLLKEPWPATCALLVMPGGADLGYCRVLNGEGTAKIRDFVYRGGMYLGFCAGGYFGSARCEFEVGEKKEGLEVIGNRELRFWDGICRGGAWKGFRYGKENGAKAARLGVKGLSEQKEGEEVVKVYFNGGGVFVDAEGKEEDGVEVMARYLDELDVEGGRAAIVRCKVGDGAAILTGPHPEFSPDGLHPQPDVADYDSLIAQLAAADPGRISLVKLILRRLGLQVNEEPSVTPALSNLHMSSLNNYEVGEMLYSWEEVIKNVDGMEIIEGDKGSRFRICSKDSDAEVVVPSFDGENSMLGDSTDEENSVVLGIVPHEDSWPSEKATPKFDHELFYTSLRAYRQVDREATDWGSVLLYGEVITSTNTLLERNHALLSKLPTGFTLTATYQTTGRGRGSNVWVTPRGSLVFSTVINHAAHLAVSRPIVFIQYLAAVATVEAVRGYDEGYGGVPVRLKWPNDIYARDPRSEEEKFVKIGGILSNCAYSSGTYQIILGIGVNVTNHRPTTSLDALLSPLSQDPHATPLAPFRLERLLARILTRLETLYAQFLREGFSGDLESKYYQHWLHTGQAVTLEAEGNVRARVLGITSDWGMLKVEEMDGEGRATGKVWALQSDENSFDFWKGLIRRKV